jgi:hypothetical protein
LPRARPKYLDPRAATVNARALGVILGAGTTLVVWGTYDLWPTAFESPDRAGRYPLVSSIVAENDRLRPEPTAGQPIPSTLRLAETTWAWPDADRPGKLEKAGDLVSYNVVVSKTQRLDLVVESAGAGAMRIAVDGGLSLSLVGRAGQPQSARGLLLTKGLHTMVVESLGGMVWLRSLSIEPAANRLE